MTIYIVKDNLKIIQDFFDVANFAQFERDMNDTFGDCWFDNIEDAEEYLYFLAMNTFNIDNVGYIPLKDDSK